MSPDQELRVREAEEWPAQGRVDRELVVGPLDGAQRVAHGLDLLALVVRAPAHQHVRQAPRLERAHHRTRDVGAEALEAAKQQADVPGLDRHEARL